MRSIIYISFGSIFVLINSLFGCIGEDKRTSSVEISEVKTLKLSHIDSMKVIENSLLSGIKELEHSKDFLKQPLKIMPSNHVRLDKKLQIAGYQYELKPEIPDVKAIIREANLKHPEPYVEINMFKIYGDTIKTQILFRFIGQGFNCFLNKKLRVDKVNAFEF